MSRSIWKGLFFSRELFRLNQNNNKITNRSSRILPLLRNKFVHIYNGKKLVSLKLNKEGMFNHNVGEFVFTKKRCVKIKKDKKNFKLKK